MGSRRVRPAPDLDDLRSGEPVVIDAMLGVDWVISESRGSPFRRSDMVVQILGCGCVPVTSRRLQNEIVANVSRRTVIFTGDAMTAMDRLAPAGPEPESALLAARVAPRVVDIFPSKDLHLAQLAVATRVRWLFSDDDGVLATKRECWREHAIVVVSPDDWREFQLQRERNNQ